MIQFKRPLLTLALCLGALSPAVAAPRETSSRPPIDMVFAIDCSGSMGGVIETAKQKVWDIVNEIARAKPSPRLRIGLLAYGNGSQTPRKYDLSDDLDTVYGNLMTFRDEGWSAEYVGQAVQKSVSEMSWSAPNGSRTALRVLYMVGNETALQGPISYKKSAPAARERDIFVNAIYCGNSGGQETWQEMASLGGGKYLEIAGDGGNINIPTPYDRPLAQLNQKLNGTYLAYGVRARAGLRNQIAQDSATQSVGGAASTASRALAKSSLQYNNSQWDLVDKAREKSFELRQIPRAQLPAPMQQMTPAAQKTYLAAKSKERQNLQKQIQTLGAKRGAYIQTAMKKRGKSNSLDAALLSLVRSQAVKKGFRFGQ
jgi:hypothetical protein